MQETPAEAQRRRDYVGSRETAAAVAAAAAAAGQAGLGEVAAAEAGEEAAAAAEASGALVEEGGGWWWGGSPVGPGLSDADLDRVMQEALAARLSAGAGSGDAAP